MAAASLTPSQRALVRAMLGTRLRAPIKAALARAILFATGATTRSCPIPRLPPGALPAGFVRAYLAARPRTGHVALIKRIARLSLLTRADRCAMIELVSLDGSVPAPPPRGAATKGRAWCPHCRGFWSINHDGTLHGAHRCAVVYHDAVRPL